MNGLMRTRWAAIGAAVAVTLGAGGLYSVRAASAPSTFISIDPTRVLDTRINAGLSGTFTSDVGRNLQITGTVAVVGPNDSLTTGTPVPPGATAIVANLTAVGPTTEGFVSARAGGAVGLPTTSNINVVAGQIVPNSVTIPLSASGAVNLWFHGTTASATSHLLLDIVGYYTAAGAGAPGPAGPAGPRGFSAWDVIPSGVTVTGVEYWDTHQPTVASGSDEFSVQLPGKASVALTSGTVNFSGTSGASDADAACNGTVSAPTAPPGKVCVYIFTSGGINVSTISAAESVLPTRGFYVNFTPISGGTDSYLYASWAYTAP